VSDYIDEVFGQGGYLSKQIKSYEPRPGQIALARSIDEAIREGRHVIAEGPTGIGKSLAYSVPAAYHAIKHGKKICIVTSNKTLQQQIYGKDLADLRAAVPWNFTYAIRKGISSYLCERNFAEKRYEKLLHNIQRGELDEEAIATEKMIDDTVSWANRTDDGDSELITGTAPNKKVWNYFSTDRDNCDGKHCSQIGACRSRQAAEAAGKVDIVVTNYWMFYLHIRNSSKEAQSPILPSFSVVILDEAHNASDIARGFWGIELSKWTIRAAISKLKYPDFTELEKEGERLWDRCWSSIDNLWDGIEERYKNHDIRFRKRGELKTEGLENALDDAARFYKRVGAMWDPGKNVKDSERKAKAGRFYKRSDKCAECRDRLEMFRTMPMLDADRWKRQVYYIDRDSGYDPKLHSKSLFVGAHLRHKLFDVFPTVVQTSATLAIHGRSNSRFTHLKEEMGMHGLDAIELTVESPFRWREQCLLVVPDAKTIPSYTKDFKGWEAGLGQAVEEIIRMVGGRTMVLFTALARMDMVREHLEGVELPFPVYCQGKLAPAELKRRFIDEVDSVLLGSKRFSEGIDVQGESCTCVIIDKLPFKNPNDPVLEAIGDLRAYEEGVDTNAGGKIAFMEHSVPEAIISFKQRLGRLIRTVKDCGVVVVMDDRLKTRGYGYQFVRSIPPIRQTTDIADIKPFLESLGAL
jgi:ATP-dependent DNA helicase DinG